MSWDERLRFNASDPPSGGLDLMAQHVSGGSAGVVELRRLPGGVDAATHAVQLEPGGWFVLKRANGAGASRSLAKEFDRLRVAQRAPVATPEPIALDADGSWFGHPALVMTLLPGVSTFHDGVGSWLDGLAQALVSVHSTPVDGQLPEVVRAPHAGLQWQPAPPTELPRSPVVEALIQTAHSLVDELRSRSVDNVLLHHDFHHGNVLWDGTRVTGVLDWNEARLGPAVCDVAYCSVDIAMTHGISACDSFTRCYAKAAGSGLDDLYRWQCLWTANALRWAPNWVGGFQAAGIDLTLPVLRQRLEEFARATVRRA